MTQDWFLACAEDCDRGELSRHALDAVGASKRDELLDDGE